MTPNPKIYQAVEAIALSVVSAAERENTERKNEISQRHGMPAESAWRQLSKADFARATEAFLRSPYAAMSEAADGPDSRSRLARMAAFLGYAESLEALAFSGPTPWRDTDGAALGAAAAYGHLACVELLLPISNPAGTDEYGHTPLHRCAAAKPPSPEILAALLPRSDAHARGQRQHTALMFAALRGCTQSVKLLLPHSDPAAADEVGNTALVHAAQRGHLAIVELLLAAGAPRATGYWGRTALMGAADFGCVDCVQLLLPVSDPAAVDRSGWNALMFAAKRPRSQTHFECGRALLPFVDPLARNAQGQDALWIAEEKGLGAWADLLAPAMPKRDADRLFERLGAEWMPEWAKRAAAEAEAKVLRAEIDSLSASSTGAGAAQEPSGEAPPAVSERAPAKRL